MSWQNALLNMAKVSNPKLLGRTVHLAHNTETITVFDGYPKSKYHFLLLPRLPCVIPGADLTGQELNSITDLFKSASPLPVLKCLQQAAKEVVEMIQLEMDAEYGFRWPINRGFHADESMRHLHLHIISNDLLGDRLKTKQHFLSFTDPQYFLDLDELIQQLEEGVTPTVHNI